MLFVVSKIVGFFAIPSNLIISIGVIGLLLLLTRYARAGRRLAFGSLILLVIVGLSPLGNALIIPQNLLAFVAEEGPEHELMETYIVNEVEKGAKLPGLYPMNDETKARYEAWKKSR